MKPALQLSLLLFVSLAAACQPRPTATVITNVTVIDAVNGVRQNQDVIFDADRITAISSSGMEPVVKHVIDGTGKFLIPGLWDFHVHLTFDDRFTDSMPALFLSYGITSVRDTGGALHKILPVVEKMRRNDSVAPRVFFAGPLLDGDSVVYDGESLPEIGIRNTTPDEARAAIIELQAQGVDFIKIYEMVSPAVFDAMVATANELGLPIDSHVPLSVRARTAGPRVDAMEHLRNVELDCTSTAAELHATRLRLLENPDGLPGSELRSSVHSLQRSSAIAAYDQEACDQTLATLGSTLQVPTLRMSAFSLAPAFRREDWNEALSRIPPAVREEWQASSIRSAENSLQEFLKPGKWRMFLTGRMHAQGIPIGAGTDTPILLSVPGYSLHSELEYLVRAGLSPLEAIESATVRPAEFFHLQHEMGTIDVGKKADLVLLNANPLEDIANTKKISGVVTRGKYFDIDSLLALLHEFHQEP